MATRRQLFGSMGALGIASTSLRGVGAAVPATFDSVSRDIATDEDYWSGIQQAFAVDRTLINLNNGSASPSPRVVHEALRRHQNFANEAPYPHLWLTLEPAMESVRRELAAEAGCGVEEIAITRNASEALQIAQLGIELKPGDEVLTTNQDYGRMLNTWEQRVRRDGIVLKKISFPVPNPGGLDDLASRFERAISQRTRVIHFCHITNLTGQIFPVQRIARMARERGIKTIVDGAHAFAHFPYQVRDLDCDYYGVSLHKWLLAPIGTGFLYVRKENIPSTWPLQPASAQLDANIRKFEEIGTHPAAIHNAIAEALHFHRAIGVDRRAARMRYLRNRWEVQLEKLPGIRLLTPRDHAQSCGLATFTVRSTSAREMAEYLWNRSRIVTLPIEHDEFQGIRVTPNIYTTTWEIDAFVDAVASFPG